MVTRTAHESAEDTVKMLRSSGLPDAHQEMASHIAIGLLDSAMKVRLLMEMCDYTTRDAIRVVEAAFAICLKTETAAREEADRKVNT